MKRRALLASALALTPVPLLAENEKKEKLSESELFVREYVKVFSGHPGTGVYLPIAYVTANDVFEDQVFYVSWYMSPPQPGQYPQPNVVTVSVPADNFESPTQVNVTCYSGYYYVGFRPKPVAADTMVNASGTESGSTGNPVTQTDSAIIKNK
jgi:hypothetical protein